MQNSREVIIFAELFDGRLHSGVPELCSLARGLADQLSGVASAILIGTDVKGLASELISYGMDKVYAADDARQAPQGKGRQREF